jgi:hypothetical protein
MMEIDQLNSSPNLKSPRRDNLDSASKRNCNSPSLYNTLLAPTKIANTLSTLSNKNLKCVGYDPQIKNIYSNFPFQIFDNGEKDINFVFENGKFHGRSCAYNNYTLSPGNSTRLNSECDNIQYNKLFLNWNKGF